MRLERRVLVIAMWIILALAGCSSDDDPANSDPPRATLTPTTEIAPTEADEAAIIATPPTGLTVAHVSALEKWVLENLDSKVIPGSLSIWQSEESLLGFAYVAANNVRCLGVALMASPSTDELTIQAGHIVCEIPTQSVVAGSWQLASSSAGQPVTVTIAELLQPEAPVQVAIVTYADGTERPTPISNNRLWVIRHESIPATQVLFINEFGYTEATVTLDS